MHLVGPGLLAAFHARHYSPAYLAIFAVIIAVGYAMIAWRRGRASRQPERPYRPAQGLDELELHPPPAPPAAMRPSHTPPDPLPEVERPPDAG